MSRTKRFLAGLFVALSLALNPAVSFATQIFITSGTSWTVPADWNSAANTIEALGAGAGGSTGGLLGGGGGAWAKVTNFSATPGASIPVSIGVAGAINTSGTDTQFNSSATLLAKAGLVNGIGGPTTTSVGSSKFAGGGSTSFGGGGAAGPNGAGVGSTGTAGGNGDAGFGGAGGSGVGVPGSHGMEWDATHGSGGGGGRAAAAGAYGAGGGSDSASPGVGTGGILVINYTPLAPAGGFFMGPF